MDGLCIPGVCAAAARLCRPVAGAGASVGEVAPAVEDQRRGALAALAALDFADEDHVVAFGIAAAVEALEHRRRAVEAAADDPATP